jgi:REP element-mobilizing transposase RayT
VILAYHAIFTAYGFWLPNDPRGSWSTFIGSWELFRYGAPIPANSRASLAHRPHDVQKRLAAKQALKYHPVTFDNDQIHAIARGFQTAVEKSSYTIRACTIMSDHVHAVIERHQQTVERMVGHLKGRASTELEKSTLHPFLDYRSPTGELPSPWAEKGWNVFLDTAEDIQRAIRYVNNNPIREGLPPQDWPFLAHL